MEKKTYTYSEVYEASKEYFEGNDLAAKVFVDKYALQDNDENYLELTPADMHDRLAGEFARIEKKYPNPMSKREIFNLFDKFKYVVPQGSPMSAIGNPYILQSAGNCFVIEPPFDSYGGICKADQELTQIMKRRGGVGLNISNIRPRGLATSNAAKTTDGIGVFMERFSNSCKEVAQLGRRGALLQSISIKHPEIRTFINIKRDKKKVTGSNISIWITDEFMDAVSKKKKFKLQWPVDSDDPEVEEWVDACELWDEIITSVWEGGEPGLLFEDTILKNSIPDLYAGVDSSFRSTSTNPCLTGDTMVAVADGRKYVSIKELAEEGVDVPVYSVNKKSDVIIKNMAHPRITGKNVPVYKVTLDSGHSFKATKNHEVFVNLQGFKKVEDLKKGDSLFGLTRYEASLKDVFGEHDQKSQNYHWLKTSTMSYSLTEHRLIYKNVCAWRQETLGNTADLAKWAAREVGIDEEIVNVDPRVANNLIKARNNGYPNALLKGNKVYITKKCEFCDEDFIIRYKMRETSFCSQKCSLKFAAKNGTKQKIGVNKFYEDRAVLQKQKQLNIYKNLESELYREPLIQEWENKCREEKISFRLKTKHGFQSWEDLKEQANNFNHRVVSIKYIGTEDVYNGTVEDTHQFFFGNFDGETELKKNSWFSVLSKNCGELVLGKDSCRLMLLNLFSFIKNPFEKSAKFDFGLFYEKVGKAQRLMDDLIDLELEIIDKIIKKVESDPEPDNVKQIEINLWKSFRDSCKKGRRCGLGVTAVGDAIAAAGLKYGSTKSGKFVEKIYKTMALAAHKESAILAKERGSFKLFDYNLEKDSECPYLKRVWKADPEIEQLTKKYGRRNIALTTTAPCGSVSILTQTTSGIEPVFQVKHTRRKKCTPSDKDARIDFVDRMGDSWTEYEVVHPGFEMWKKIFNGKNVEDSPYFGASYKDIDWVSKVKMQGLAQKWVSHSISNTSNIPKDTPKEVVSDIYFTAWKEGCKGVTVYRDGSRDNVLVSDDDVDSSGRPAQITPVEAPKRPKELLCEIHHSTVLGVKWTVIVGLLNKMPYELFMGQAEKFNIPNKITEGKIVKVKRGKYDLLANDNSLIVDNIVETSANEDGAWTTRMMSTALRHGVPIEYLVEQLAKDGSVVDINNVLSRLLRRYIKKRDNKTSETCPQCGSSNIIYSEGCKKCGDGCGWTGCG